jgi:hypothetical protein
MQHYALAFIAGIWLADGIALLIAPLVVIQRIKETIAQAPGFFRWQILGIVAGVALLWFGLDLAYQPLWTITAIGMVAKGAFLWIGPPALRTRLVDWCLGREAVDYRFWGLGLCALAVLLLHALGWIGRG